MINQEIYDLLEVVDHTGVIKKACEVCEVIYPEYDDTQLKDISANPGNSPESITNLFKSTLTDDIVQFLNMHGVFTNNSDSLDIYVDMATPLMEMNNPDNAGMLLDLMYDDDSERTIAEMSAMFSTDYSEQDFLEVIDHIDDFAMEKMTEALDELVVDDPISLPKRIVTAIKKFTTTHPDNIAIDYLNQGGPLGGSAETYINILNVNSDSDPYREDRTLESTTYDLVSIFIITGHSIDAAKVNALKYINKHMDFTVNEMLKISSYINLIKE